MVVDTAEVEDGGGMSGALPGVVSLVGELQSGWLDAGGDALVIALLGLISVVESCCVKGLLLQFIRLLSPHSDSSVRGA
jgi:hypothetical protein